ncbi:MAG: sugar nucleotide-binding protein [Bacteroidota bacterium]|nr:sugar nucleotide-binding protein [Bacteroidota bacterium]
MARPANDAAPLQVWAGVECTINRIGDKYNDQCVKSGHKDRLADLALFAELQVERLRYPCLWETVSPDGLQLDWEYTDQRLNKLRELGQVPIAGLLHHGSGPTNTDLLDPDLPQKFAAYANAFAERYPWINDYTPINEPLTTARFSALYGFWYPHKRSDAEFLRSLLLQMKASIMAFQAIRAVNPNARLIQTEDLGRCQSTEKLDYQANFENERRWLSLDLLCGKVDEDRPMIRYMLRNGVTKAQLQWFIDNATPPDIIGINHYQQSNRYLDHRLDLYPGGFHGSNTRHRYADVGAIHGNECSPPSPYSVLKEVWDRYRLPLAVTEVHIDAPREGQLRWFKQVWDAAQQLRMEGADVRAVTAWSLLGTYDWNTLCTTDRSFYEPGVFDVSSGSPRPTAIAHMVHGLATTGHFPQTELIGTPDVTIMSAQLHKMKPLLITGATGTLGSAFARVCDQRNIRYQLVGRNSLDIADPQSVDQMISALDPWAVINTAGYVRMDQAESEPSHCYRENLDGAQILAAACSAREIPLLTFSTDQVFNGDRSEPYLESSVMDPLNVYGRSKAQAEQMVLDQHPDALVVRTSSFFGPWDEHNFVTLALRTLFSGEPFKAMSDVTMSPTYVPHLVHRCLDLLIDRVTGIVHLANSAEISWYDFAHTAAEMAISDKKISGITHMDRDLLEAHRLTDLHLPAPRPMYSALASERVGPLPDLENALQAYFRDLKVPFINVIPDQLHMSYPR